MGTAARQRIGDRRAVPRFAAHGLHQGENPFGDEFGGVQAVVNCL